MSINLFVFMLVVSSLALFDVIAVAEDEKSSHEVVFKYDEPVGELYLNLTVTSGGRNVRTLHGDRLLGRAYERTDPQLVSQDGNFVYLSQIESGFVEGPNDSPKYHEVAYCELLDVRSGCIVARETGEFCGGSFTFDGGWDNPLYPDFNLAKQTPSVFDYVSGKLTPADSPESSFENLLICDPPSSNNVDAYRSIIKNNVFHLDDFRREAFERDLKLRH